MFFNLILFISVNYNEALQYSNKRRGVPPLVYNDRKLLRNKRGGNRPNRNPTSHNKLATFFSNAPPQSQRTFSNVSTSPSSSQQPDPLPSTSRQSDPYPSTSNNVASSSLDSSGNKCIIFFN